MTHSEIRQKFLDFFKKHGHAVVPSSSLIPDDPSVLLTTAGMQQFKKYYTGEADPIKDFGSKNTASIQKSFRTSDIDEVGDESHLTFFEMLGNFSFGGYFKEEAIKLAYEFITKEMGLKIDYVSVFGGEGDIPADNESEKIWKSLDVNIEVKKFGRKDNFWGPTGNEGPSGPTTEIYVKGVEIWNIVFNQYYQSPDGSLKLLETPGIDTGMGLERLAMAVQGKKNIFETDLFNFIFPSLPIRLGDRNMRIAADHLRAAVFLISDGVRPSNKEQGYILRRLIRRVIVSLFMASEKSLSVTDVSMAIVKQILRSMAGNYNFYSNLDPEIITDVWEEEEYKFKKTYRKGLREMEQLPSIDSSKAFYLFQTYGLSFEIIKDQAGEKAKNLSREEFDEEFRKHQEISRAGAEKKFGGHGMTQTGDLTASSQEELKIKTRLHTATHLLHASLRKVLGDEVQQRGSDITAERLRFDFAFPRKLTPEEISETQKLANDIVRKDLPVIKKEMPYEEAIRSGALAFFREKYPKTVSVYSIGDSSMGSGQIFSKELCGGPHVSRTGEIGRIIIKKEEAVGAGVRRIRAVVE